jgi:cobalt-zinc-cadmium efflux system protein
MRHRNQPAQRQQHRFLLVLGVTLVFLLVELVGGWLTGSLALLADAGHLLGDAGALLLALVAMRLVQRPSTTSKTYGDQRAEILAALFNGLLLWLIAGLVWHEAFHRLQSPPPVRGVGMTAVAAMGLAANVFNYAVLSSSDRGNLNIRAAILHLLGDIFGSVGALVAGLLVWLTGWTLADPIVGILIGGLILITSWGVVKDSIDVLMESTPKEIDLPAIMTALGAVRGLNEVHDVHAWSLRSGVHALTLHGVIDADSDDAAILSEMTRVLADQFNIHHTTIQLDRQPGLVQITMKK